MHRAARVLERDGYAVSPGTDTILWGNMGPHHAVVICSAAPGGLTHVSIVVSSLPPETIEDAVGQSRRLKDRMEEMGHDRDPDRRPVCTPVVAWTWVNGHTVVIDDNGSVAEINGEGNRSNSAQWVMLGGNRIRIAWNNGYVDTLTLSADGSSMDGTNNEGSSLHVSCRPR
jgi:hypothetical protein